MTLPHRVPAVLVAAVLVLAALPGARAAAAPDGAGFARPEVGTCHQLTLTQFGAESDSRPAVRCEHGHDTVTIAAPIVTGLDFDDTTAALAAGSKACVPAITKALGPERDRKMSAYDYIFFYPSKAERAEGASWIRCDVVMFGGTHALPVPAKIHRLGRAPYRDALASCLTAESTSYGPLATPCSRKHAYRAVGTVRNPARQDPSMRGWHRFAAQHCPKVVGSKTWYATWPYPDSWTAGERVMTCYAVTKR